MALLASATGEVSARSANQTASLQLEAAVLTEALQLA
jgi:hypothetical protein